MSRGAWFEGAKETRQRKPFQTVREIALAFGVGLPSTEKHRHEFPKEANGTWLPAKMNQYFRELKEAESVKRKGTKGRGSGGAAGVLAGGEGEGAGEGLDHWKERKTRADALRVERENALADGKLLIRAEVQPALENVVKASMGRLRGVPRGIALECEGRTAAEIEVIMLREIDGALLEISKWKL